jgi:flagellar biosynthesis protein FlhF
MKLRSFTAATIADAMAEVRAELGPDAIIVSTETVDEGARVTAALDEGVLDLGEADILDGVHEALEGHGIPPRLIERLLAAAAEIGADEPHLALAGALDTRFGFAPLSERPSSKPLMLVGPPGAGKTISLAKLAARAVLAGKRPRIVTCDTVRAGGIEQLAAFTRLLEIDLHAVDSAKHLATLVAGVDAPVLIDSAGINPWNEADRAELAELIDAAGAEPVLVLPAGGDLYDTVEMAEVFAGIGCRRLLATRLDLARRLGSLVAAAEAAHLSFSDVGITPSVAEGLLPLTPVSLARLLLPEAAGTEQPQPAEEERAPS